jgi:predicted GNAT family acetyltransferase
MPQIGVHGTSSRESGKDVAVQDIHTLCKIGRIIPYGGLETSRSESIVQSPLKTGARLYDLNTMQYDEKTIAETTATRSDSGDHGITEALSHTKQSYTMKMDWRLIPILGCTYTILFLDRTNSKFNRPSGA